MRFLSVHDSNETRIDSKDPYMMILPWLLVSVSLLFMSPDENLAAPQGMLQDQGEELAGRADQQQVESHSDDIVKRAVGPVSMLQDDTGHRTGRVDQQRVESHADDIVKRAVGSVGSRMPTGRADQHQVESHADDIVKRAVGLDRTQNRGEGPDQQKRANDIMKRGVGHACGPRHCD